MKKVTYKGHTVELVSEQFRTGRWVARATVVVKEGRKVKQIPIYGRRRGSFDSRSEADAYGLELAKLWIEGRIWGGNGRS
jgi:hypothetical protein